MKAALNLDVEKACFSFLQGILSFAAYDWSVCEKLGTVFTMEAHIGNGELLVI